MSASARYLERAAEADRLAEVMTSAAHRRHFRNLAAEWRRMAEAAQRREAPAR